MSFKRQHQRIQRTIEKKESRLQRLLTELHTLQKNIKSIESQLPVIQNIETHSVQEILTHLKTIKQYEHTRSTCLAIIEDIETLRTEKQLYARCIEYEHITNERIPKTSKDIINTLDTILEENNARLQ